MHLWLTIITIFFLQFNLIAQNHRQSEFGLFLGSSNYQGDLAPNIKLGESNVAAGFVLKRNYGQFFSFGLGLFQGQVSGKDENFDYLYKRGLSFSSSITEISGIVEFNFFPFSIGLHPNRYTPYVFTGISTFKFDPTTIYNGQSINLVSFDTEGNAINGQRTSAYSLIQAAIPIGGGFKFKISKDFNASFSVGFRRTFTDYLDDVSTVYYDKDILANTYGELSAEISDRSSNDFVVFPGKQRGRDDLKDWYIISGFMITYKIKNNVCPNPF